MGGSSSDVFLALLSIESFESVVFNGIKQLNEDYPHFCFNNLRTCSVAIVFCSISVLPLSDLTLDLSDAPMETEHSDGFLTSKLI